MPRPVIVERIDPAGEHLSYLEHVARYRFALSHVYTSPVLDIAAGTGYGANMIAEKSASTVVSVDVDLASLTTARRRYPAPLIHFINGSGTRLPFASRSFGGIITLETLEHIDDDRTYLAELSRVLRDDGTMVLSTPNRVYSLEHGIVNPFHMREYVEDELERLLRTCFADVQIYFQGYSDAYRADVQKYAGAVQNNKQSLPAPVRWGIDNVYRPLRDAIPPEVTNRAIGTLFKLKYPMPDESQIAISDIKMAGANVLVAVARAPRR